ncbi:aquaporin-like [Lucilia sericata]|uniref:aquaporin-like n=1 Tax=Lucilia sericata TaxID=13632 RepID=UPI0018A7F61A|nr:aquaporin-like [Lucilia sericata]
MKSPLFKCLCAQSPKEKVKLLENLCCLLSEFIGTGMLMFLGCMGCIESDLFESNNLTRSLNFGIVVLIIIQCFGCCSGAHLNPAVTLASYIYNMLSLPMVAAYIVAQILGAICGYGLLKVFLPMDLIQVPGKSNALCLTAVHSSIATWQAVGIEMCITATLVWVCCGVWDPRNKMFQDSVPIRFGLTVASLSITAGPLTGASMNPARSLAPAVWNNQLQDQWIYWIAPLLASIISANFYKYVFKGEECKEEKPMTKMNEAQISCP